MGRKKAEDIEDLDGDEEIVDQPESDEVEGTEATVADEDSASDEDADSDEGTDSDEATGSEFGEAVADDALDEYDETDLDLKVVDEVLSHKDQNARALAIRRAIEERLEAKRLSRDLDYLELDPED